MRVNVYAEELTDRVELVTKEIDGHAFTAVRFYLELPASTYKYAVGQPVDASVSPRTHKAEVLQIKGPFIHRPGDDDSSAVTFWGKRDLRPLLRKALALLEAHYGAEATPEAPAATLTAEARADLKAKAEAVVDPYTSPGPDVSVVMTEQVLRFIRAANADAVLALLAERDRLAGDLEAEREAARADRRLCLDTQARLAEVEGERAGSERTSERVRHTCRYCSGQHVRSDNGLCCRSCPFAPEAERAWQHAARAVEGRGAPREEGADALYHASLALYLWLGPREADGHVVPPARLTVEHLDPYTPEWRGYLRALAAALVQARAPRPPA